MATTTAGTAVPIADPTRRERVVDALRHVAHVSHEAKMLKSVAADAVEDSLYRASRAAKVARRDFGDARDETVYRIKQDPLRAVGLAFGAGVLAAAATGGVAWLMSRVCGRVRE